jgi:iron complex outermembrane receptor protein
LIFPAAFHQPIRFTAGLRSEISEGANMSNRPINPLLRGICSSLSAILAAGFAAHAQAQTAPAAAAPDKDLTEIVVTGTLLHRTDTETESPVTVFSAQQIQQSGLTTVADVVRTLTADNSGTIPNAFGLGFAAGASGVALRGLTVNSTLVLIDGRRAAPYALADDGQRSFVDLNTIPLDTVERIEVLKDGASSIYGADAIAGVVNIILKKQLQGASVSAEVGKGQHPGGGETRFTASAGTGDLDTDRYNAYFSVEWQGDSRILASDRPFPFNTTDLSSIGGPDNRVGTPGSFTGSTSAVVAPSVLTPGSASPAVLNTTQVGAYQPLTSCGPGTSATSAPSAIAGATDNYCLQNRSGSFDDQPAQQRIGVSGRFTVKVNDTMQAYINASYYQNNVIVDTAPAQLQNSVALNTENIALPPTLANGSLNPNDPFAALGEYALTQYAFSDIQQQLTLKNHNFRMVTGLTGKIMGDWDFDTALVINHTWLDTVQLGLLSAAGELNAVESGSYNFVNPSLNSAAVRAAISPALAKTSTTDLDSLDFKITHDILQLPGGPLGVALGAEARYEAQDDPALNPNANVQGIGVSQTIGSRNVWATYAEFGLPVVKMLNIDISGRYDHYSDFGGAFTPKAGFKFTPIKQLAVRGTYSQGFRAPSFAENGSSSVEGFITQNPTTAYPANFCAPNVHSAAYCLPYTFGEINSANPNIKPERSDSYTFGVIFEPISQLSLSADFYDIKKKNTIVPGNAAAALAPYFAGQPIPPGLTVQPDLPDPSFPGSLPRPLSVSSEYVNANELTTDGIDIDLRAKFDFDQWGKFSSDLSVTKIFSFKLVFNDGTSDQYVGTEAPYNLSSGAGTPRYRGTWANTYYYGPASLTLTTYYVSGFRETGVDATGDPNACLSFSTPCHVASFTDFDLTGIYHVTDHLTASFSVLNLFDKLPPIDVADYAGINYNPTYAQAGIVGRFFKLGAAYKF